MKFFIKHKKGLIIFLVIAAAIAGLFFGLRSIGNKTLETLSAMSVETAVAEKRDLVSVVSATGKIVSAQSKDISSTATGVKVKDVLVEVGDEVKEGDTLVILDSGNYEKSLATARDNLSNTKKTSNISVNAAQRQYNDVVTNGTISMERFVEQIEDAQKKLDDAKNTREYYKNQYDDYNQKLEEEGAKLASLRAQKTSAGTLFDSVSDNDVSRNEVYANIQGLDNAIKVQEGSVASIQAARDMANSSYISYNTQVETLENSLKTINQNYADAYRSANSQIAASKDSLDSTKISSSTNTSTLESQIETLEEQMDACVIKAPFDGIVTAIKVEKDATYAGMAAVTVEDISAYEISTEIDEYDIGKVKKGQKVVIKTNGTGDAELMGTVKSIAPRASVGTSVTYKVIISVDTSNDMLRLDMTAKLSIVLEESKNTLSVPYDAVLYDDDGNAYVEVVDGKDEIGMPITHKVYVTTGIQTSYYTEIISLDIKEGDEVKVERTTSPLFDFGIYLNDEGAMGGM